MPGRRRTRTCFQERSYFRRLNIQMAGALRGRGGARRMAKTRSEVTESWAAHQHDGASNFERTAQMPAKSTVGGNALAKRLAYLTVADNEAGKSEELGLGAAQAQEEDARRAMAEKRKEAQKIEQQKLRQQAIQDVAATTREAESLRQALQAIKGMPLETRMAEVMANVFKAGMDFMIKNKSRSASNQERVLQALSGSIDKEMEVVEKKLTFLATVGSTAPFIGLFGTVWGIMNSFQSIAISKNTSLAIVAPGIAEALFATALGLLAAIPAVVAYNKFTSDSRKYSTRLENFSQSFISITNFTLLAVLIMQSLKPTLLKLLQH